MKKNNDKEDSKLGYDFYAPLLLGVMIGMCIGVALETVCTNKLWEEKFPKAVASECNK